MIFLLAIGIYNLSIRPGYLTDNRRAKNRIGSDIVVYPFATLVISKTDWWQRHERNIPVVITITTESIIIQSFNSFTVTDETIQQETAKWVALTSIPSDYMHMLIPPWSRILLEKLTLRQEIPSLLWKLMVQYNVYKTATGPHPITLKIHFNIILPSMLSVIGIAMC